MLCYNLGMRRPGNLAGMGYWFGETNPTPSSMVTNKLEEIRLANIANKTPITKSQMNQRIVEHLTDPKKLMKTV